MSLELTLSWETHQVRMVGTPDAPEWIAADVCGVLELRASNPWKHLPDSCKGKRNGLTPGGWQRLVTVNEQGLYRLIASSRVPAAERFRRWLFGDVLPCIRKYGCYPAPAVLATREQRIASALLLAQEVIAEKDARLAVVEPKAEVYDEVMSTAGSFEVAVAANLLARPHRPMGERRLFAFMRKQGITQADNRPYQEHVDAGRFVVVDKAWKDSDGESHAYVQTRVTQRGIEYLLRRLDAADGQRSLLPVAPARRHEGETSH